MQLGIGTVQFGMDYGISNSSGCVSEHEAQKIFSLAGNIGCLTVDTAAAYGQSEAVLGRHLPRNVDWKIVTKTRPLRDCVTSQVSPASWVRDGFKRSLERLDVAYVEALLVHHPNDLLGRAGAELYSELSALKNEGVVKRIGLSAYSGRDVDEALNRFDIDLVQIPLNVFDQRMLTGGQIQRLRDRSVEIHVRSIFLQGLLLMDPSEVPGFFDPIRSQLQLWRNALDKRGMTPSQGAFAFIRSLDIDVALVGVTTASQLKENLADFENFEFDGLDFSTFAIDNDQFINPSNWVLTKRSH